MEGLNIYINKIKSQKHSGFSGVLTIILLIIVGLILLPVILLLMLVGGIYNLLFHSSKDVTLSNAWQKVLISENIEIEYKWVKPDNVPENLLEFYEERGLIIFNTNPKIDFFKGYFSDFKVERDDGIFVQKIILDSKEQNIQSAPLFFFKFENHSTEEIIDLKSFEFESKGSSNDFIIIANSKNENIEIRLTK